MTDNPQPTNDSPEPAPAPEQTPAGGAQAQSPDQAMSEQAIPVDPSVAPAQAEANQVNIDTAQELKKLVAFAEEVAADLELDRDEFEKERLTELTEEPAQAEIDADLDQPIEATLVEEPSAEAPADAVAETPQPPVTETPSAEASAEIASPVEPAGPVALPEGATSAGAVEALIMLSASPISASKIAGLLSPEGISAKEVREAVDFLNDRYTEMNASFRIQEIAGGYQFYTLPPYVDIVQRLVKGGGEVRLSQAALEVLSIVAYKQPIIRADVEAIRGVACGPMLKHLLDCKLIKIDGRSEQLGRPLLYGTTKKFLQHFGLKDIKDLPRVGARAETE